MFLSNTGFTSAKANHYANMAHELAEQDMADIMAMNMFTTTIRHSTGDIVSVEESMDLNSLESLTLNRATLYTLSAWLRSAVKYKDNLIQSTKNAKFVFNEDHPSPPQMESEVDEQWGREQLSIAELTEFLSAEATAAHIGKIIHDKGLVSLMRNQIRGTARFRWEKEFPVILSTNIQPEQIDELFFKLQHLHREAESRVNYYKAKIHKLVSEKNEDIYRKNAELQRTYTSAVSEYNNRFKTAEQDFLSTKSAQLQKQSQLKIVIPHGLEPVIALIEKRTGVSSTDGQES